MIATLMRTGSSSGPLGPGSALGVVTLGTTTLAVVVLWSVGATTPWLNAAALVTMGLTHAGADRLSGGLFWLGAIGYLLCIASGIAYMANTWIALR